VESHVSLVLLGSFQARLQSGAPVVLSSKAQALLAYLAIKPGRRHARDKLASLLWPNAGDEHARQSLRQALLTLRHTLGDGAGLLADHREVALESPGLDVDVVRFEALAGAQSIEALERAVELYQGDLLEGIRVKEPPFDEWLLSERERLREVALGALGKLLGQQQASGPAEPAIRTAMRILALDPANESAHRELMRLFERQGRHGNALRQYRLCVDALQRELGVEPRPETRLVYQEIVRARRVPPVRANARATAGDTNSLPVVGQGLDDRARPSVPLIGRDSEMSRLSGALDAMGHGEGRLVIVLGEAGIGKSSLLEMLDAAASRRGVRCHLGRSYLSEQVLAFAPWIEGLRAHMAGDPQLEAQLGSAWMDELARLFPDIDAGSPGRLRHAPEPHRLFEAMARLLSYLAATAPRLIMLEDVHWADEMSLRLLAFVARRVRNGRTLIVATAGEEELTSASMLLAILDELAAEPRVERMNLAPLSRAESAVLVRSLARVGMDDGAVARLADRLFGASGGNPFMIVESMRALADGALTEDSVGATLPDRVRQVIARRLDRLAEQSRSVLAAAAVIGREFDFALLLAAAGLDEMAVAEEIETLIRCRVLRVVGERFDFVHDQVRGVAYGQLLPARRRLLHAGVARAIERLHEGRLAEQVERLAHHAFHGELWEKAVEYGRQAGHIAAERSASAQASACFAQALQALGQLPEGRETLEQGIDLRQLRMGHHFALGEREAYLACVGEALALAERLGDPPRLARIVAAQANALWFAGDNRAALQSGRRAVELAASIGEAVPLIQATLNLGLICNTLGDYHEAAAQLARAAGLASGELARERLGRTLYPAVNARAEWARALAELGQFDAATTTMSEAIRLAEALQHSTTLMVARLDGGHVLLCRGEWSGAISALEAILPAFRAAALTGFGSGAAGMLGYAQSMMGEPRAGIPLIREALEHATRGRRTREALFTTYLSEALLRARQPAEAATLGERALVISRERDERGTEARARYVLGEIAAADGAGDRSTAECHYHDAIVRAGELGMRPLVALCHLGLARLERRAGERRLPTRYLAAAKTMFREMGMSWWLERAEAETEAG
jgi:DNA-binding SARP family transcriptional activator